MLRVVLAWNLPKPNHHKLEMRVTTRRHLHHLHGRFEPGQRVAGRYRIVSLLGKGGMGEVYRADDLVLGQSVAVKFLPEDFANDSKRLEYFFSEVRLARQVSHPNVCRVHSEKPLTIDRQSLIRIE